MSNHVIRLADVCIGEALKVLTVSDVFAASQFVPKIVKSDRTYPKVANNQDSTVDEDNRLCCKSIIKIMIADVRFLHIEKSGNHHFASAKDSTSRSNSKPQTSPSQQESVIKLISNFEVYFEKNVNKPAQCFVKNILGELSGGPNKLLSVPKDTNKTKEELALIVENALRSNFNFEFYTVGDKEKVRYLHPNERSVKKISQQVKPVAKTLSATISAPLANSRPVAKQQLNGHDSDDLAHLEKSMSEVNLSKKSAATSEATVDPVVIAEVKPTSSKLTMAQVVSSNFGKTSVARSAEDNGGEEARKSFLRNYFQVRSTQSLDNLKKSYSFISNYENAEFFDDSALLGQLLDPHDTRDDDEKSIFMNTNEPFCLVAVGTQGNGKSHSVTCVLESCLIPYPEQSIINLNSPMNAVVFHYDSNINYICEATGVIIPIPHLTFDGITRCVDKQKLTILVTPMNYPNRKMFYADGYGITVKPLLFEWKELTADHIKKIMGVEETGNQLYMSSLMEVLIDYQSHGLELPPFEEFVEKVKSVCTIQGQMGPLDQRLKLLARLVKESACNEHLAHLGSDLGSCCQNAGTLVICDLSDPLLSKQTANGIFQVLTEQYKGIPAKTPDGQRVGKLLVIDEAHKFMDGTSTDGLSNSIVDIARLMRHDGIRLIVSTQSPKALAPELLELSSMAIMHQFTSRDWFDHLASKLPLALQGFKKIMKLRQGEALVFARRHDITTSTRRSVQHSVEGAEELKWEDDDNAYGYGDNIFPMTIRPRITMDLGASVTNVSNKR